MSGRRLEFRVWHIPTQCMYKTSFFNEEDVWREWDYEKTDEENWPLVDNALPRQECIILQFTGMRDMYDQDIWEGDVLRLDQAQCAEYIANGEDEYSCYTYVVYNNGGFAVVDIGVDIDEVDNWRIDYFANHNRGYIMETRVGCRYEHPELMDLTGTYPLALRELSTKSQFVQCLTDVG